MGNLFGNKNPSKVTDHDKAILQVKNQRDRLCQYQRRVEKRLDAERSLAIQLIANGKRDRAKLLLRKKRFQEQLLDRVGGQLENLERLIHDLEFSQVELQVLDGLKVGNQALKKANDMISIEDVEKIMDETKEAVEKQQEIEQLLSGVLTSEDEEEVARELEELISLDVADLHLPDVPSQDLPTKERGIRAAESKKKQAVTSS